MSYATITQCSGDLAFQSRLTAAVSKEGWNNPALGATDFGALVRENASAGMYQMVWPVAIDVEAAYESAVINGNPNPGGDPSVITDAQILAAVQAHWPPDPTEPT